GEVLGLRWRRVSLADPAGAYLRVSETFVRNADDTPKSEASTRTLDVGDRLAAELMDHRGRTPYDGDDERVFSMPTGCPLNPKLYAETFRAALAKAEIADYIKPFRDGRHTSITNAAAAATEPP